MPKTLLIQSKNDLSVFDLATMFRGIRARPKALPEIFDTQGISDSIRLDLPYYNLKTTVYRLLSPLNNGFIVA